MNSTSGTRRLQWLGIQLMAAFVALAMFSIPARAQGVTTETESAGGTGGNPFRLSCPSGMVMVGVNARYGDWVDALSPICAAWVGGNRTLGEIDEQPAAGGNGGALGAMRCQGPRGAIVGLYVWPVNRDTRRLVGRVLLDCGDYERPAQFVNKLPGGPDGVGGAVERERLLLHCGPREVAVGLYGRSGTFIDRVGLLCQRSRALAEP